MTGRVVEVSSSIGLEEYPTSSPLRKVVSASLDDWNIPRRTRSDPSKPYWNEEFFRLSSIPAYRALSPDEKERVVKLCSIDLLQEATLVEQSATSFTSKMTLLSRTTEERMLYSLFAAEEVAHYAAIRSYLEENERTPLPSPFIKLLNTALEEGDKCSLTFVIQVVLEGWGLTHFSHLAESCHADDLRQTLRWFVKHEARHHGSGLILFNEHPPSASQVTYIVEVMAEFLQMIRIGPVGVLSQLSAVRGDLTRTDIVEASELMEARAMTQGKLNKLRSLMLGENSVQIVTKLEQYGLFAPSSAEETADALSLWRR